MKGNRRIFRLLPFICIVWIGAFDSPEAANGSGKSPDILLVQSLLEQRQFEKINKIVENYQKKYEKDISTELFLYDFIDSLKLVSDTNSNYEKFLSDWVNATKSSWVPFIVRADYYQHMGSKARGTDYAKNTTAEQFKNMKYYDDKAVDDIKLALSVNPHILKGYSLLLAINMRNGNREANRELMRKVLKIYPHAYLIRVQYLRQLTPPWGGSYEEMAVFIQESLPYANKNPLLLTLPGFIYLEKARMADTEDFRLTYLMYKKALTFGETFSFRYYLADYFYRHRIFDRALSEAEKAVTIRPNLEEGHVLKSKIVKAINEETPSSKNMRSTKAIRDFINQADRESSL